MSRETVQTMKLSRTFFLLLQSVICRMQMCLQNSTDNARATHFQAHLLPNLKKKRDVGFFKLAVIEVGLRNFQCSSLVIQNDQGHSNAITKVTSALSGSSIEVMNDLGNSLLLAQVARCLSPRDFGMKNTVVHRQVRST